MYTVMFHRTSGDREYGNSNNVFKVVYCETLPELYEYVRFESYEQERLSSEDLQFNKRRYYYGDHGFLVLKNGVVITADYNFIDSFIENDIQYDTNLDADVQSIYLEQQNGVNIYQLNKQTIFSYIYEEEQLYKDATYNRKKLILEEENENKEKQLLKELLKKYPDER